MANGPRVDGAIARRGCDAAWRHRAGRVPAMHFGWQPPCVGARLVPLVEQPRRAYLMAAHGVRGTVGEREIE